MIGGGRFEEKSLVRCVPDWRCWFCRKNLPPFPCNFGTGHGVCSKALNFGR